MFLIHLIHYKTIGNYITHIFHERRDHDFMVKEAWEKY